jgi:hypothetical protein
VPASGTAAREGTRSASEGATPLLDIVYVLGMIAVFVLVGLIGKGVEKL